MKKYILSICTLAAICLGCVAVTSCSDPDDLNDLVLDRILSPTGITARISQDVNIIVSWDEMKGATSYEIEAYAGQSRLRSAHTDVSDATTLTKRL